jgi:hypothetical protein
MNEARLLLLADALEHRIPADKFDLAEWRGREDYDPDRDDRPGTYVTDAALLHGCGTTGCAVGWACALPEFNAEGLTWDGTMPAYHQPGPLGLSFIHFEAVNRFFGICEEDSSYLFLSSSYDDPAGPLDVAARIREFVANRRA